MTLACFNVLAALASLPSLAFRAVFGVLGIAFTIASGVSLCVEDCGSLVLPVINLTGLNTEASDVVGE